MELVSQDDDADVYLVVVDVDYFCSDVDVLLDVHADIVVHNDQLGVDDVLTLILDAVLMSDVVVDILVLYDVVADHDALCISLPHGLLNLYVVCINADDVVAIAMSSFAFVDAEAAFIVASLVGVASLLWMLLQQYVVIVVGVVVDVDVVVLFFLLLSKMRTMLMNKSLCTIVVVVLDLDVHL